MERKFFSENPVRPKKSLGQHFLNDKNIALKIVESIDSETKSLLEIGPGTGVLTDFLLERKIQNFKVVEIDTESIDFLKNKYAELDIIEGDFLKLDISSQFNESYSIIGNFPYNISSQIFFKILEERNKVDEVVCMLQQEVAKRIASKPRNKDYGILSVLLQAWYDIEYLFTVPPQVFTPPPKVTSAVIRLKRNNTIALECDEKKFVNVIKTGFNQRRKTLHNALKPIALYNGKFAGKRAEELSVDDFVYLTLEIFETS
jgi:16S rRNA (adenine1518-N6/adenine1519-N6)-dimethyltransferase